MDFRQTFVASGPGLLAQARRKAGRMDPVLLLYVFYFTFLGPVDLTTEIMAETNQ